MQDRYRNRFRVPPATGRARRQIALEAARRLFPVLVPNGEEVPPGWLDRASASDYYLVKRRAAAVLGHRIRPGDLPSDDEVREHLVRLWRDRDRASDDIETPPDEELGDESGPAI